MQLVVLTAGEARRLWPLTLSWPKALLSLGGRPAIFHQLLPLINRGFHDIIMVVSPGQRAVLRTVVGASLADSPATVRFVEQAEPAGPGAAFALTADLLTEPALLLLGDTLCEPPVDFQQDWIGVAPYPAGTQSSWCTVASDESGNVTELVDKPTSGGAPDLAAIGLYFFTDPPALRAAMAAAATDPVRPGDEFQLKPILDRYREAHPVRALPIEGWCDLGTRRGYQRAVRTCLPGRLFNELDVSPAGVVHKHSSPEIGLEGDEALWFSEVPPSAQLLAPRFLGSDEHGKGYSIEYLDYLTLAEHFAFGYLPSEAWPEVIADLLALLNDGLWARRHQPGNQAWARRTYLAKSLDRLRAWDRQDLLALDLYRINGRDLPGFRALWQAAQPRIADLVASSPGFASVIHGDLSFGNILYAPRSGVFRLIDPRRSGGPHGVVGDQRYEGAKLRQCYHGRYDLIVADLYRLAEPVPGTFDLALFPANLPDPAPIDRKLAEAGFDIGELELIEALLFLSMIPLHAESSTRQLAFFVTGIECLARSMSI